MMAVSPTGDREEISALLWLFDVCFGKRRNVVVGCSTAIAQPCSGSLVRLELYASLRKHLLQFLLPIYAEPDMWMKKVSRFGNVKSPI